jgi:hypothetical protein
VKIVKDVNIVEFLKGIRLQNLFLIFLSGIVGVLSPLVVTWDGYLYLGSGQAISNNLMETQYHWLREPLYPLILSLMESSIAFRILIVIQTISIMVSLLLWSSVLKYVGINLPKWRRLIVNLATFSFLWGFGGTILLQSFWILLSSLLIYLLSKWSVENKNYLLFVAALLVFIQLLSTVFFFCTTLAVVVVIVVKKLSDGNGIFSSLLIAFLVFVPSLGSLGSWEFYKNGHTLQNQIYPDSTEFWNAYPYNNWNGLDKILAIPSTFLALNSMGVEFYQSGFYQTASESRGFGMPTFSSEERCGRLFPGPEKYIAQAKLPDIGSCVFTNVVINISVINKITKYTYPILVWIGFLIIFQMTRGLIISRNFKLLSILLFLFLIQTPYLISNAGISRLGIPTTSVFVLVGVARVIDLNSRYISSNFLSKKDNYEKKK